MQKITNRIAEGRGCKEDIDLMLSIADQICGRTICAFGEAAAWPVQGFLRHYWDEFEYYVRNGRSIVEGEQEQAA